MKTRKALRTIALTALLSTSAMSTVWAVSDGDHGSLRHDSATDLPNSARYVNSREGQMMVQATPMLETAMNQATYAGRNYGHMQASGDSRRIAEARSMLTNAETMLTTVMADLTGAPQMQIRDMHNSGLSWRQVGIRIGIDMAPAADWGMEHGDDYHDQGMGVGTPTGHYGYDHSIDMHENDSFHSEGSGSRRYREGRSYGHGGGMMGGMMGDMH